MGRFRGLKGGQHDWTGSFRPQLVLHCVTFLLLLIRLFKKACLSLQVWQMMVEELSVSGTCLYRECLYTDNDFHLILGFKSPTQKLVFTFNLVSRKGSLHRHWF